MAKKKQVVDADTAYYKFEFRGKIYQGSFSLRPEDDCGGLEPFRFWCHPFTDDETGYEFEVRLVEGDECPTAFWLNPETEDYEDDEIEEISMYKNLK